MSTTSPRTAPPRGTAFRAALILAAAGTVLTGCGRAAEPVASHQTRDPAAGAPSEAVPPPITAPPPAGMAQEPAATPTSGTQGSPVTAGSAVPAETPAQSLAPLVAPVLVAPDDLADIDRSLADIEGQLNDAGKDAATPEGDLG